MGVLHKQALGRHDLTRGAEATLPRVVLYEGLVNLAQLLTIYQTLGGGDLPILGLHRQDLAGIHGLSAQCSSRTHRGRR